VPELQRFVQGNLTWHSDRELLPEGILIAFSERTGGRSAAPYATLNLSDRVGDGPAAVAENRRLLMSALGLDEATQGRLHSCIQVHGADVVRVDEPLADPVVANADALVTATPNIPLLVCIADCVGIILVATGPRRAIAVVHSGWKGTLARIAAAAVDALHESYGAGPGDIVAYLGPYIGPESFEVDAQLAARFAAEFPGLEQTPGAGGIARLDLGAAVSQTLRDVGVAAERIVNLGVDTAQDPAHFYSYRAQDGTTGRQGALACLLPEDDSHA